MDAQLDYEAFQLEKEYEDEEKSNSDESRKSIRIKWKKYIFECTRT